MRRHSTMPMMFRAWVDWMAESADAGTRWHALCVIGVAVFFPAAVIVAVEWLAWRYMGWMAWLVVLPLHVVVLYLTLGFRQFSQPFNSLKEALEAGNVADAVQAMRRWRYQDAAEDKQGLIEAAHRYALEDAHYYVFGVLFAYMIGAWTGLGAAGAVLYRLAAIAYQRYRPFVDLVGKVHLHEASPALQRVSASLWNMVDYIPSRCTAAVFALLGNFEHAAAAWREMVQRQEAQPHLPPEQHLQVVQAAGAGALGVMLPFPFAEIVPAEEEARDVTAPTNKSSENKTQMRMAMEPNVLGGSWGDVSDYAPEGMVGGAWYQNDDSDDDDVVLTHSVAAEEKTRWVTAHLHSLVALLWRSLIFWLLGLVLVQLLIWFVA